VIQISIIRERNVSRGIIISSVVTVGSYIIISIISIIVGFEFAGFYLFADIQFAFGTIFGVIITLNNRLQHQSILKSGVIVGITGGILSSVLIGLYEMIIKTILYGPDIRFFIYYFGIHIISGIVVGLIGGAFIGSYYMYKETKKDSEKETLDDDFFDDLIKN
jgi:Na+/proline symporter